MGNAESGKLRLPLTLRGEDARMAAGQHRTRVLTEGQHHATGYSVGSAPETPRPRSEPTEDLAMTEVNAVERADRESYRTADRRAAGDQR